jgi:hypothetical protein
VSSARPSPPGCGVPPGDHAAQQRGQAARGEQHRTVAARRHPPSTHGP